jgi:hypothetical protein
MQINVPKPNFSLVNICKSPLAYFFLVNPPWLFDVNIVDNLHILPTVASLYLCRHAQQFLDVLYLLLAN